MKDVDLVLILALLFYFFFSNDGIVPVPKPAQNFLLAEGMVAMAVNDTTFDEDTPIEPTPSCDCNGTKKVKSGDGLVEIPCPCGDGCVCEGPNTPTPPEPPAPEPDKKGCGCKNPNCKCSPGTKSCVGPVACNVEEEIYILPEQILYFGAEWCIPCKQFDNVEGPPLIKAKWGLDTKKNSYLKKLDYDKFPNLVAKYEIKLTPTYIMIKDGKVVERLEGYQSHSTLTKMFYKYKK